MRGELEGRMWGVEHLSKVWGRGGVGVLCTLLLHLLFLKTSVKYFKIKSGHRTLDTVVCRRHEVIEHVMVATLSKQS